MIKYFIYSVVLCGSETLTLLVENQNILQAFEMWIWRRILKVSLKEYSMNEDILCMVQEERSLMSTIKIDRKTVRSCTLMKIALEGRIVGKKTVGRPRVMLFELDV